MRHFVFMTVCFVLLATVGQAATLTSTFDTDADGWVANVPQGALTYSATGGDPGGHIRIRDTGAGVVNGFASGALFGPAFSGDLSAFDGGTLTFDMRTFVGVGGAFASFGTVFIYAPGDAMPNDQTPEASADAAVSGPSSVAWESYSLSFDATTFGLSQTDWEALLADVEMIGIATDAYIGADTIGIDNVVLTSASVTPVPLPAGLALLISAIGLVFGLRRKA